MSRGIGNFRAGVKAAGEGKGRKGQPGGYVSPSGICKRIPKGGRETATSDTIHCQVLGDARDPPWDCNVLRTH